MNKAVIWDLDGVLADTAEAHFRAWVTALAEWEIPLDRPTFDRLFGMNNRDMLTDLLGRPPEPHELGTIAGRKEHFFHLVAQQMAHPLPGALELLADLEMEGWLQAIASSAPPANINLLVDKFGIRDRFRVIFSGEELPAGKPDPALFLKTADALRLAPERCVVVEDAPAGVAAARRARMRCIAVATPLHSRGCSHTRPRAALSAADLLFDDLTQITTQAFHSLIHDFPHDPFKGRTH